MHDKGYSYNGNNPISGLTKAEISLLQLGHLLHQEEKQETSRASKHGHKSKSDSYNKRKRELVKGYQ